MVGHKLGSLIERRATSVTWSVQPLEVYAGLTKSSSIDSAGGPSSVCPAEIFKSQIFWEIIWEITYGGVRYTGHCSRERARSRAA